ncbi:hypothetical protein [Streptomyces sp. NPDC055506]
MTVGIQLPQVPVPLSRHFLGRMAVSMPHALAGCVDAAGGRAARGGAR